MRVRHDGISTICPGCGAKMADTRIAPSLFEFRAKSAPVCRMPAESLGETVFKPSVGDSSDGCDSIWAGWLID